MALQRVGELVRRRFVAAATNDEATLMAGAAGVSDLNLTKSTRSSYSSKMNNLARYLQNKHPGDPVLTIDEGGRSCVVANLLSIDHVLGYIGSVTYHAQLLDTLPVDDQDEEARAQREQVEEIGIQR